MAKIYIAARFDRREEIARYADTLSAAGHEITSRWLSDVHSAPAEGESHPEFMRRCARDDVDDVLAADVLLSVTENENFLFKRGGRHVEFGIALQAGKRLIVMAERENVFHHLEEVEVVKSLKEVIELLKTSPVLEHA